MGFLKRYTRSLDYKSHPLRAQPSCVHARCMTPPIALHYLELLAYGLTLRFRV